MCKRLSDRAADDLLAFVRKVRRTGVGSGATARALEMLAEDGGALLAKHGLLTPADDPEVAGVFMQEGAVPSCHFCGERHGGICALAPLDTGFGFRYANKESGQ